jgi:Pyruvate/2-oxoacid:ferredoxin oxidoreductase delta subunit
MASQARYDQVTMYVFSGTGNTLRAAGWMAEAAEVGGVPATVHQVVAGCPPADPPGPSHLVGLLAPTHGFTAPWCMIRFALRMPRGQGTHAFVAVTRGSFKLGKFRVPGMEGTAGYLLALLLLLKGYRVRGVLGLDMPGNWTSLHSGFSPQSVEFLEERARPLACGYLERLLSGQTAFGGLLFLALGLLLLPVSLLYLLIGHLFLAKLFFANNACNGCGLCAQKCPVGAIRMVGEKEPRPFWTYSCEGCHRCMAYCPKQAVEAGHSWGVLLYYAVSIPVGWLGATLLASWSPWVQYWGMLPLCPAMVCLCYLLFWSLLRIRAVNALFTWTTLTHYYRRYHEPSARLRDLESAVSVRPPQEPRKLP